MVTYADYSRAVFLFLNNLLILCYVRGSEPEELTYPYLTYDLSYTGSNSSELLSLIIRVNDGKLTSCVEFVDKIGAMVNNGYKLRAGDGYLVIRKGSPFAQIIDEQIGDNIKSVYINLDVEVY